MSHQCWGFLSKIEGFIKCGAPAAIEEARFSSRIRAPYRLDPHNCCVITVLPPHIWIRQCLRIAPEYLLGDPAGRCKTPCLQMSLMATPKRCSGVFAWRPYWSVQNSTSIDKFDGWLENGRDVQANDGPVFTGEVQADCW